MVLGWQVRRLQKRHNFKVVAVAGSIGKTSTKLAITQVLSQGFRIQHQEGNYNDLVTVPLIFFGHQAPNIYNPLAWLLIFWKNEKTIRSAYPYEAVVVELGTDGPGQMRQYQRYIKADIGVLTAIAPEHMEFFTDLDDVAREELTISKMSKRLIVNKDLCPADYLADVPDNTLTYAIKQPADFRLGNIKFEGAEASFDISAGSNTFLRAAHERVTEPQLYSINAAAAVGVQMDMTPRAIEDGIRSIKPVSGRMQQLAGINGSIIIDDTYNASPEAMRAALDTLYRIKTPQKIALLGNMNELGGYSPAEHKKIGEYCDPRELDLVLTLGPDANKYLAPAAEAKGCKVSTFDNPYTAGDYLKSVIKERAVILAKGSQNGVFAEEALKQILARPADAKKLVRQSKNWMKIKHKAFASVKIKTT